MHRLLLPAFLLLTLAPLPAATLQESWETGYKGTDATGKHVLGYWKFDAGAELMDSSGKGHELMENGATLKAEGRLGQGIESDAGAAKPHALRVTGKESLTPAGAFTLEMWIKPKPEFDKAGRCYLMDKRYVPDNHTDYAWQIMEADAAGSRSMSLALGFGAVSATFYSDPFKLITGEWQHIAITYDAAGTTTFYHNGSLISQMYKPGLGSLVPGVKALHIGDRIGSNYGGFPGFIDEVRLCSGMLRFESISLEITSPRRVWQRMERAAPVILTCVNLRREPVTAASLTVTLGEKTETFPLPSLASGATHEVKFAINTELKPDTYTLQARLQMGDSTSDKSAEYQIVPRPTPQMPVILWGGGDLAQMKDVGFTHYMALGVSNMSEIWTHRHDPKTLPAADPDTIASNRAALDEALANGMNIISRLSPGRYLEETHPELLRVDRSGKPYTRHDIAGQNPELPPFFEKVGRSFSSTYGQHPALAATLLNSEVRDASQPSFTPDDINAYRHFANADIPTEVVTRRGVDWTKLKDFPADRVIPDDHPILKYYRWFWTVGDGWNSLHSALNKGVKSSARRDFWTFFDPAVRQPSISGAGGNVDVLSHWTYTYPDPQRIGLCTDQLLAMSEASGKRQRIMKMTQLIWYRSQTAPIKKAQPEDAVAWEDHDPDAAYITIAPMHLKEAFWTKLSRPIDGIMYHGWQSLVPTQSTSGYKYTNPNTVHVLKELIHDVIRPLGPTLMSIPDERAEVAVLESFTSQMFASRGGYGGNLGWAADLWLALQHAHIRTDIMFEETLLKNGLSGRKILVMPDCDVLTTSVVERIQAWQKKGGKIIADENLCPALTADLTIPSFKRTKNAAADKAQVLALATTLGPQLLALGHTPHVTADSPEVILRTRRFGDAQYLFVINDHREAGNYVGQRGLVMENGLPTSATLSLAQENATIYDLTRGSLIIPQRDATGLLRWQVDLGPCDGRIFMILPKPLLQLTADLSPTAKRGQTAALNIRLTTTQDTPLKAVIPVEIQIRDANGKAAEGSGHYAAENGLLTLPLSIATNDDPGTWEVRIRELASRMETTRWMTVTP
ncbi:concanavalin A-like lectin/glucanase superfamily protein [Prosthecobacter fusiformis]|uniref:Concanavalin A-like lectin/glucanase superfamily protein n=1 Tax=Prosthecobacter fusiformis TaxID=48464 RepID=A0A4R7RJH2_9BACT|nr:LamG domain-containing protein [Prosthecobacter fusiformis]TDU62529.1 concanavalin A-like lectin/glucanase superfamily protein [Prosthecobacter fusiformis]